MSRQTAFERGFDVGVCATGDAPGIGDLISNAMAEGRDLQIPLNRVFVVASECDGRTIDALRRVAAEHRQVDVWIEKSRSGKASAINRILEVSKSELLVLANSDAHPEPGAVAEIVRTIESKEDVGVVAAKPTPEHRNGLTSALEEMMWTAHNECSLALNHMNISNHSSDELVVVRRAAISRLPRGLVNDGAFMAAIARLRGYSVRFSQKARVRVETPTTPFALIDQRRRILFGHLEVWRKTGSMPRTMESMAIVHPTVGLALFVRTLARHPRFIGIVPVALVSEALAGLLSVWDTFRSTKRHQVWRRYQ